jgi:hypothetical protein
MGLRGEAGGSEGEMRMRIRSWKGGLRKRKRGEVGHRKGDMSRNYK